MLMLQAVYLNLNNAEQIHIVHKESAHNDDIIFIP